SLNTCSSIYLISFLFIYLLIHNEFYYIDYIKKLTIEVNIMYNLLKTYRRLIMNSKDLEYIYNNIPYDTMNIYDDIKTLNTVEQYINKAKELGFKNNVKKLKNNHKQLNMLRKDGSLIGFLRNPVYPSNSAEGRAVSIDKIETEKILTL